MNFEPVSAGSRYKQRLVAPVRWYESLWVWAALLVLTTAVFAAAFHPLFLVFDTYDYMFRGMQPSAYGSHPFLFGLVLRGIARLSNGLWRGAFPQLFQAWQLGSSAILVGACLRGRRLKRASLRSGTTMALLLLALVSLGLVLAPLIYLANGYVSEPTEFALLALGAAAFAKGHDNDDVGPAWLAFGILCLVGYHVRYQLAVLPVAAGLVIALRFFARRITLLRFARHMMLIAIVIIALPLSQRALAQFFPVDEYGRMSREVFFRKSIQCTLGCSVRLFETSCESEAGRNLIERSPCWHMVHIQEPELGKPYPQPLGIAKTFFGLEPQHMLKFLVLAPLNYLREKQRYPLEIYAYAFDDRVPWFSEHVPDVIRHYGRYMPRAPNQPSPAFRSVLGYLELLYDNWGYHWLSLAALFGSLVGLFATRDAGSACLYATTIGTFFLFSYFQPQVPVRYAVHLALPAVLAAWRDLLPVNLIRNSEIHSQQT